MATIQEQLLGQAQVSGTAASVYTPSTDETAVIKNVTIANVTTSVSAYSLYLDNDGTTYGDATALFKNIPIAAGETHILSVYWPMDRSDGNLGASCTTTNDCTISVFGLIIT